MSNISPNGLAFIERWEVLKLQAYKPTPDDVWTIGYGHTHGVFEGQTITKDQAIQLLYNDVNSIVVKLDPEIGVDLTQNQFDALVSLCFNVGVGSVLQSHAFELLNEGDFDNFKIQAFSREHGWTKQAGHILEGLVNRRAAEQNLFDS